jgi:hypothetical protein
VGAILTAAGWVFLPALAALAALLGHQALAKDRDHTELAATAALITTCGGVCICGVLGLLPGILAIILAAGAFIAAAVLSVDMVRKVSDPHPEAKVLGGLALVSWLVVRDAFTRGRKAAGKRRRPPDELAPRRKPKTADSPAPPKRPDVRAVPDPRPAPPPRSAPALTSGPLPRAVAEGRVSQAWAQVISGIADFEAGSDAEFLAHWQETATGMVHVADAIIDQAEYHAEEVGLAPVIVTAMFDGSELASETSSGFAAVRERLLEAYQGARGDAAAGHDLPKDGRWVTGEDAG